MKAIQALFCPRSVAVIGASARSGALGHHVMANLHDGNFMGPVMPVHPRHACAQRILCYPSVDALPLVPDLAVLCTPPHNTPELVGQLAARGTGAAVVLTADPEGKQPSTRFKAALADAGRAHGLGCSRVLGPGSLGVQAPALGLNASLIPAWPAPGNLALVSQSGSVAVSVVEWAKRHGIGFSHVVSTGDGCDIELGDLLDYLAGDMRTRAVLLHVRSVRDGPFFLSAARALARIKPVIAIRPRDLAAPPMDVVPAISPDSVYGAAFRRSGVLRVDDIGELFDAVESLGYGKRHSCEQLAVLGNGAGLGQHAATSLLAERTRRPGSRNHPHPRRNPSAAAGYRQPDRSRARRGRGALCPSAQSPLRRPARASRAGNSRAVAPRVAGRCRAGRCQRGKDIAAPSDRLLDGPG